MKVFKKIAYVAVLVLLTFTFVKCEDLLAAFNPPEKASEPEFVDWEYEDLPDGTSNLTVYLDGTLVPVTEKTGRPKQNRALNLQLAKMSHDYFEVVFWNQTTGTPPTIARASWELGQAAGISGVYRSGTGADYTPVIPAAGGAGSVIFVGRKATMTLLGVGVMTQINKQSIGVSQNLTSSDRSVTFTVSPLQSKIAIDPITNLATTTSSFVTAANSPAGPAAANITPGRITALGGTDYPLFILPDWKSTTGSAIVPNAAAVVIDDSTTLAIGTAKAIPATYTIGGLDGLPIPGSGRGTPFSDLKPAIILYDVPEFIKREPRYISGGQTWYAVAQIDFGATFVKYTGGTTTGSAISVNALPLEFYITEPSNGIFSITFSIPVYAMTLDPSDNGGPPGEIWHITPGYGQNLYNLDNGTDAGGCVLLGINVSSLDWLEIFTTGLGFKH